MCTPQIRMSKPNAHVMVLGSMDFRKFLGHESRAPMNGISALPEETPESSVLPSTKWGHSDKISSMNQKVGPHQTLKLLDLILDL